jgi:hypothetical protein
LVPDPFNPARSKDAIGLFTTPDPIFPPWSFRDKNSWCPAHFDRWSLFPAQSFVQSKKAIRPFTIPDPISPKVTCRLDRRKYPTGRDISNDEMQRVNLERDKFHGEWNYIIKPRAKAS